MAQAISNTVKNKLSTSLGRNLQSGPLGGLQRKGDYTYSPAMSALTNRQLNPALFSTSKTNKPSTYNYQAPSLTALGSQPAQGIQQAPTPVNTPSTIQQPQLTTPTPQPLAPVPTATQPNVQTNTVRGLFPDVLTSLQGAATPTANQANYLQEVGGRTKTSDVIGKQAKETADKYAEEIARVGKLGAGATASALSTGTNVVGAGNAAIASQSASNRINALSTALASELQGNQQQLTANEQAIGAATNALGGANTQQQLGIGALGTAGNLAAPSPAQYGQTVFNPVAGGFAGGNMDPQIQAQQLAAQVASGAMTYDQALASLNYAGPAGTNFLNNALTGAGANPLALQAQGAAQQANVATQTSAGTEIARQGLAQATQNYVQLTTDAQFAHDQANAVSDILARTGLNNVSSTDYNKALRNVQQRFSDVDRTALNTALLEAQNAYTNLLSSTGGTPTGNEERALNSLNIDNSAAAITASITELENAVARRLQSQYSAIQQYQTNLGSGQTFGQSSAPTSGVITWDQL